MKLKFRFLKIILLLIAFVFLLNFTRQKNDLRELLPLDIYIIDSLDKKFITNQTIKKIIIKESDNQFPKQIKDVNVNKIERKLKSNIFTDSVNVSMDINGQLKVFLRQKTPVLRVNNSKEKFYLTDKNQFLPLSPNYSYKCMLVDGNILGDDREKLIELTKIISEDKLLKSNIIGIRKIEENLFNLLVNYGGFVVEFGDLNNSAQKLENLKGFYTQYLNKIPEGTYKKISLKYNNQIVAVKKIKNG